MKNLVYKYASHEREDILVKGSIRFTQAAALNDPFESTPNLLDLKEYLRGLAPARIRQPKPTDVEGIVGSIQAQWNLEDTMKNFEEYRLNKFAFLSVSKNRNNLLMWAHYSSSHTGFVIGFDSGHKFFQTAKWDRFSVLREVKYSPTRPRMPGPTSASGDLAELMSFTKSDHWAYEQELRMVANPKKADEVIERDDHNIYLFQFPLEAIEEVIFGYRMPRTARVRLARIIGEKYPKADVFAASLNEEGFELDIAPFVG